MLLIVVYCYDYDDDGDDNGQDWVRGRKRMKDIIMCHMEMNDIKYQNTHAS